MIDIKLFVRNLIHNKLYFAITVLGFAIALTFVLVLSVYIRQELSVDQFHQNKDRIYRVVDEEGSYWGAVIGSELQSKYPEIECYTRYYNQNYMVEIPHQEKILMQTALIDSSFFRSCLIRQPGMNGMKLAMNRSTVVILWHGPVRLRCRTISNNRMSRSFIWWMRQFRTRERRYEVLV